ncbi:glycosyltransferase 87 family protein [Streptomyces sp. NPDC059629]|uniref:glycosyltransferase 87 family protein n=1 Tax=Streptomyces sp. NPDC059629 TaxID=3346889 RepID=UPI0036BF28FD
MALEESAPQGSPSGRARLCWAGAGLALAALLATVEYLLQHDDPYWAMDLRVYEAAGQLARHGHSPYPHTLTHGLYFTYPPFTALLLVPLSFAGTAVDFFVVSMISLLAFEGALWCSLKLLKVSGMHTRAALTLAATATLTWLDPVHDTLRLGQLNLLLMLMVIADMAREPPRWKGGLIGLATGIKLLPGIFLIYLLVTRRTRTALTGLAAFLCTVLLGFVFLPGPSWDYWTRFVFEFDRVGDPQNHYSQSLRSALARVLHSVSGLTAPWLLTALAVTVIGTWAAVLADRRDQPLLALTTMGVVGALVSPISWDHYWVWIAPGLILLVRFCLSPDRPWAWRVVALAVAAGLTVVFTVRPFDIATHDPREELRLPWTTQLSVNCYTVTGTAALFFLLALELAPALTKRRRRSP